MLWVCGVLESKQRDCSQSRDEDVGLQVGVQALNFSAFSEGGCPHTYVTLVFFGFAAFSFCFFRVLWSGRGCLPFCGVVVCAVVWFWRGLTIFVWTIASLRRIRRSWIESFKFLHCSRFCNRKSQQFIFLLLTSSACRIGSCWDFMSLTSLCPLS